MKIEGQALITLINYQESTIKILLNNINNNKVVFESCFRGEPFIKPSKLSNPDPTFKTLLRAARCRPA
jgi:hypothetical protein